MFYAPEIQQLDNLMLNCIISEKIYNFSLENKQAQWGKYKLCLMRRNLIFTSE